MFDYDRFFILGDAHQHGGIWAEPTDEADSVALLSGEHEPLEPRVYRQRHGVARSDLITAGDLTFLISRRAVDVLRAAQVDGWQTYLVKLVGNPGATVDQYQGLAVTGRCRLDHSRSRLEWRPPRVPGAPRYRTWLGVYFEPDSWDGRDFFLGEGSRFVFVTRRVKDAVEAAGLLNFRFERLDEYENASLELPTPVPRFAER